MIRSPPYHGSDAPDAVSPIVGSILMVAITIIFAAIVVVSVYGFIPEDMSTTGDVGVYTKRISDSVQVTLSHNEVGDRLSTLDVRINGVSQEWAAGGVIGATESYSDVEPNSRIIVVAHFTDGAAAVIYDASL